MYRKDPIVGPENWRRNIVFSDDFQYIFALLNPKNGLRMGLIFKPLFMPTNLTLIHHIPSLK